MYSKTLFAGWADMDFNAHMENTAAARRLIAPPPTLLAAMQSLQRTGDFVELPSSVAERG